MAFTRSNTVLLGLNLVTFAGIALLWFMGVVRDRLSIHEEHFISNYNKKSEHTLRSSG